MKLGGTGAGRVLRKTRQNQPKCDSKGRAGQSAKYFKTAALNHSATLPSTQYQWLIPVSRRR
jgi:hypothetical protein